jgi:hypothetical protein
MDCACPGIALAQGLFGKPWRTAAPRGAAPSLARTAYAHAPCSVIRSTRKLATLGQRGGRGGTLDSWQCSIDGFQLTELEIDRLAMQCGLSLLQPGVVGAILRDERQVCLVDNRIAWPALRKLLMQRHPGVAAGIAPEAMAVATDLLHRGAHEPRERMQPRGL